MGFFAGIKVTSPDMKVTLDEYFDSLDVMDIQVISTLGLTKQDVEELKKIDIIEDVEGTYQADALVDTKDEQVVVKMETNLSSLNKLDVIEGRLPENIDECVVEKSFLDGTGYKIGDTIKIEVDDITDDDGNKISLLKNYELKIVGTVNSPMYISTDRGSTKLGSGVINYYLYINKDNINSQIYTNIYVKVKDTKNLKCYSEDYKEKIKIAKEKIESIADERKDARYNLLFDKANSKLQDAKNEFNTKKQEAEEKIANAEDEINLAKEKLETEKSNIQNNRKKADEEFLNLEAKLNAAKVEVSENEEKFNNSKNDINSQVETYQNNLESLKKTKKEYDNLKELLEVNNAKIVSLKEQLNSLDKDDKEKIQALEEEIKKLNNQVIIYQTTITAIETELSNKGIENINEAILSIEKGIEEAKNGLVKAENELSIAKSKIKEQETLLQESKSTTYNKLKEAEELIKENENKLNEASTELETKKQEYNKEIEEAESKLDDAEEEVNSIQRPVWYILDREQNQGYMSYMQDTDRVANLAQVFPIVFFVVAALISLTSMTRMVEEQRVQIGTLKALGYTKIQIAGKYVIYSALATLIGSIVGIFIGFNLLPKIIADIYAMVYNVPSVTLEFNVKYAIIGIGVAMICTVGATIYSCAKILTKNPATLMRPKSPKPGKRVLLEYITFIWKRLSFTKKVTARNIFRYKKRFLMTVIGVGGCTALIIAGFGLKDAISSMIPSQYGKIDLYNIIISLKEEYKNSDLENVDKLILNNNEIEDLINVNVQSVDIENNDISSVQLIIPQDIDKLSDFIVLQSRLNNDEKYILDDSGIVITEKLANLLNVKVGDNINIFNADDKKCTVKINAITENYIMHYIYMSPDLYNKLYDTKIGYNVIYANTQNMTSNQEQTLGKEILTNTEYISGVTFTSVTENVFAEVMENMDLVVGVLIISAGLLAFVVLYNLLNANISERIRELATIKVLGFYDKEVYEYISRETIILTILGILFGLVGGYFLTIYIIKTCEIDMLMFNPKITIFSYMFGVIITLVFAIIVNIITFFSLKKIDMIESLKSVE